MSVTSENLVLGSLATFGLHFGTQSIHAALKEGETSYNSLAKRVSQAAIVAITTASIQFIANEALHLQFVSEEDPLHFKTTLLSATILFLSLSNIKHVIRGNEGRAKPYGSRLGRVGMVAQQAIITASVVKLAQIHPEESRYLLSKIAGTSLGALNVTTDILGKALTFTAKNGAKLGWYTLKGAGRFGSLLLQGSGRLLSSFF